MLFFSILSRAEKKDVNSSGILVVDNECFSSFASQNLSCKPKSTFTKASLIVLAVLFMLSIYFAVSKTSVMLIYPKRFFFHENFQHIMRQFVTFCRFEARKFLIVFINSCFLIFAEVLVIKVIP